MSKATLERRAFVEGLYRELHEQQHRYYDLVGQLAEIQGRLEVAEKAVRISRDHLKSAVAQSSEEFPANWNELLDKVRFIGMRTADACLVVLRERGSLTTEELLSVLNEGAFRFSTPYPLRELNAAMLRHPHVKRDGDCWVYTPPKPRAVPEKRAEEGTKAS
jgi:hypothetical protein